MKVGSNDEPQLFFLFVIRVPISLTPSSPPLQQIVALPYLHETLLPAIDLICTEHKVVELDVEQVKQNSK